nr:hypothetical protein 2 [Wuhan insect virus 11]APG78470.1 hypothetical protein 2 [Wuhan insect virus 11]
MAVWNLFCTNRNTKPADSNNSTQESTTTAANTQLAATTTENSIEHVEITAFHDVEAPQVSTIPMAQDDSDASNMDDTHTIIQFLQRPVKLEHFQVHPSEDKPLHAVVFNYTTTGQQKPVREYQLPSSLMKQGNKLEKMDNHQYFKADIHIKVVLNANPFISGRYYLTYSPYEDLVSNARKQKFASRAGVTAYPGVEIDVQLDNSVEIIIPFASYKEAYVLTTEQPEDFVKLYLFCISPCRTGTSAMPESVAIDFTIYGWFENITLNVPTLKSIPALEEKYRAKYGGKVATRVERQVVIQPDPITQQLEQLKVSNPQAYTRVMGLLTQKSRVPRSLEENWEIPVIMQIQAEAQAGGPISGIASGISIAADAVGNLPIIKDIPIVNEIAPTVGWVADIVGGLASIFGWSKPQRMEPVLELVNLPGKNYAHTTNIDNSVSLSLSNQNELERPTNIFPSAVDEMSLEYVCQNPAIKYVIPWKVGVAQQRQNTRNSTERTALRVIPVGIAPFERYTDTTNIPKYSNFDQRFSSEIAGVSLNGVTPQIVDLESIINFKYQVSNTVLDTAPCEYVSQLFSYWRATICFKISVVKTAFHVGRLEIFFDPGKFDFNTPSKYDDADTANNYKYILDLTNDSEITIKIPFVSEQLFKSTIGANDTSGEIAPPINLNNIMDSAIGALVIRPVSDLLAPDTVSDYVDIIVWKWAENVVLSTPKPSTEGDILVYHPSSNPNDYQLTKADVINTFLLDPSGNETEDFLRAEGYAMLGDVPHECRRMTIQAQMQINIGNKAEGNVEIFLDTKNGIQDAMNACKNAVGERIINLRPLLRAFRFIGGATLGPQIPLILNWQKDIQDIQKTGRFYQGFTTTHPDYATVLSYMYRFFRGGTRYKLFTDTIQHIIPQADAPLKVNRIISTLVKQTEDTTRIAKNIHTGPTHQTFMDINPVHEISVPFYSKFRKLPISLLDANVHMPAVQASTQCEVDILRAGNDDLTFGWLMGTPQLSVGTSGAQILSWNSSKYQDPNTCKFVPNQSIKATMQGHFSDPTPDVTPDEEYFFRTLPRKNAIRWWQRYVNNLLRLLRGSSNSSARLFDT